MGARPARGQHQGGGAHRGQGGDLGRHDVVGGGDRPAGDGGRGDLGAGQRGQDAAPDVGDVGGAGGEDGVVQGRQRVALRGDRVGPRARSVRAAVQAGGDGAVQLRVGEQVALGGEHAAALAGQGGVDPRAGGVQQRPLLLRGPGGAVWHVDLRRCQPRERPDGQPRRPRQAGQDAVPGDGRGRVRRRGARLLVGLPEPVGDQPFQLVQRPRGVGALPGQAQGDPAARGQAHQAEQAARVGPGAGVGALHPHRRVEPGQRPHDRRRRAGVQPQRVAQHHLARLAGPVPAVPARRRVVARVGSRDRAGRLRGGADRVEVRPALRGGRGGQRPLHQRRVHQGGARPRGVVEELQGELGRHGRAAEVGEDHRPGGAGRLQRGRHLLHRRPDAPVVGPPATPMGTSGAIWAASSATPSASRALWETRTRPITPSERVRGLRMRKPPGV